MAETYRFYVRIVGMAMVFGGLVAAIGWFGDEQDVGPGRVPILDAEGREFWFAGIALVALAALAYWWLQDVPGPAEGNRSSARSAATTGELAVYWILPAATVLSGVLLLGVYRGTTAIAASAMIVFLGLIAGTVSRHSMVASTTDSARERARVAYTLIVHGAAFLCLSMIYIHKVRSIFSATAVLVIGVLLLLALTEGEDELFNRRLVYALVGGIMLGQVTWGLNYWQAAGWTGGAVLLVFFYLFGGLILTHLRRGVQPRDVAEYGTVSAVAFAIVVYSLFV